MPPPFIMILHQYRYLSFNYIILDIMKITILDIMKIVLTNSDSLIIIDNIQIILI